MPQDHPNYFRKSKGSVRRKKLHCPYCFDVIDYAYVNNCATVGSFIFGRHVCWSCEKEIFIERILEGCAVTKEWLGRHIFFIKLIVY
jgi:hypothetical protein